jgi:hypothetical protein
LQTGHHGRQTPQVVDMSIYVPRPLQDGHPPLELKEKNDRSAMPCSGGVTAAKIFLRASRLDVRGRYRRL